MPLRALFKYLGNHERLIQRLADSYPVRRAAQLSIAMFYRGQEKLSKMDPVKISLLHRILKRFSQNLREGIENAKKELKK